MWSIPGIWSKIKEVDVPTATFSDLEWSRAGIIPAPCDFRTEECLCEGPLPDAGVYLLLDGSEVVYVGQSGDIAGRVRTHRREGKKCFERAVWFPVFGGSERLRVEGILILLLTPKHNRSVALGLRRDGEVYDTTYAQWGARKKAGKKKAPKPRTRQGVAKRPQRGAETA
jgi:hypothetical protein